MRISEKRLRLLATNIFFRQKRKKGVLYTLDDFRDWYCKEFRKKKLIRPEVGRFDHSKPYSFDNISLIERLDNIRERNHRCGNPGRKHKKVVAKFGGKSREFPSKVEAAHFFGVNEKTVYNHCQNKTKQHFKFGRTLPHALRFEWKK